MNIICNKCKHFGFTFKAEHLNSPTEFWEGAKDAKILIVGLNPKNDPERVEERTINEMEFLDPESHPYFRDFKMVSKKLYDNWCSDRSIVAHTDLIKCSSEEFPPIQNGNKISWKNINHMIVNCNNYLSQQIKDSKIDFIICNGEIVSETIKMMFVPEKNINSTSYNYQIGDRVIKIILSDDLNNMDPYSKRRLGYEIEEAFNIQQA